MHLAELGPKPVTDLGGKNSTATISDSKGA